MAHTTQVVRQHPLTLVALVVGVVWLVELREQEGQVILLQQYHHKEIREEIQIQVRQLQVAVAVVAVQLVPMLRIIPEDREEQE